MVLKRIFLNMILLWREAKGTSIGAGMFLFSDKDTSAMLAGMGIDEMPWSRIHVKRELLTSFPIIMLTTSDEK